MNKLELVKTGIGLVVSVGVGAIVGNAVKATSPSDMKAITKFCVGVGSLVLTGLFGDMAAKYTGDSIDSVVNAVKDNIKGEDTDQEVIEEEA